MSQPSLTNWIKAEQVNTGVGELSQTDDDVVDLTEDILIPPTPPPAAASLTPKQHMQAHLSTNSTHSNPWRSAAHILDNGGSSSGTNPRSHASVPPHSKPRLQLTSITQTQPPLTHASSAMASSHSAAAASSMAAAAAASIPSDASSARPLRLSEMLMMGSGRGRGAVKREPSTAAAAAAAASAAPFTFTPPLTNNNSNHARAPQSAPQLSRQSTPPSASSSASAAAAPVGAFALRNINGDVLEENEDEKLVRRRGEIDSKLLQLDEQMTALQARVRELKNERRAVQERLDRPPPMPFAMNNKQVGGGVPVGGASSLLTGAAFWSGEFPWDHEALHMLKNVFGLSAWRISQREVINATMSEKDCFCIMPTGAGKSLLYQLPAVLTGGLTLVISPLLSLIP